ncbi:unnamed protein product [Meloidogyne enterolobii]|uniref:Uncharacterized protein n=1 Tax=Meloidogyne enterolobii TaxID=390850 RepID=A0ACB0Y6T0_MELEN
MNKVLIYIFFVWEFFLYLVFLGEVFIYNLFVSFFFILCWLFFGIFFDRDGDIYSNGL